MLRLCTFICASSPYGLAWKFRVQWQESGNCQEGRETVWLCWRNWQWKRLNLCKSWSRYWTWHTSRAAQSRVLKWLWLCYYPVLPKNAHRGMGGIDEWKERITRRDNDILQQLLWGIIYQYVPRTPELYNVYMQFSCTSLFSLGSVVVCWPWGHTFLKPFT